MEFGLFLRNARFQAGYQTTKQFFEALNPSCSYSHYTRIEKGEVSPDSKTAWELLNLLGGDQRIGMMTWSKDQMPSDEAKRFFSEISSLGQPPQNTISNARTLTIRESHIEELVKNPVLFEIIVYLNITNPHKTPSMKELCEVFKINDKTMSKNLKILEKLHLVSKDKDNRYTTEHWVVIPFEPVFGALRDANLDQALAQCKKIENSDKFRFTYTRFVTEEQYKLIVDKLLEVVNSLPTLPDEPTLEKSFPATLGVFLSERRFGNA